MAKGGLRGIAAIRPGTGTVYFVGFHERAWWPPGIVAAAQRGLPALVAALTDMEAA